MLFAAIRRLASTPCGRSLSALAAIMICVSLATHPKCSTEGIRETRCALSSQRVALCENEGQVGRIVRLRMQESRHVGQEVDRFDGLSVVHQSGPQRDTRVVDTSLVAVDMSALNKLAPFVISTRTYW